MTLIYSLKFDHFFYRFVITLEVLKHSLISDIEEKNPKILKDRHFGCVIITILKKEDWQKRLLCKRRISLVLITFNYVIIIYPNHYYTCS